ncbi:hypothetical protein [Phaeovulum sp. NW3]|uniref:hypothetical protein n=1 Tax=Phaeovulum sp. NW3 TaxID=2934933 RepID=UPI0020227978|nr:hypothetical protein [Phaeovulum sp. NW3]MCL7466787.1 hypothetical protein [Phaeovulum sp. NW3]
MWDFSISRSFGLMARTLPFILFRLAVYLGVALGYVLVAGTGAGIGYGIGSFGDADTRAGAALIGGGIGFALFGAIVYGLREYLLYLVKAGHIAVMVELLAGRPMPEGRSQIGHAQAAVRARFAHASTLFAVDQVVRAVLRAITGLARGILSILPGLDRLAGVVQAFLNVAVGLIDEVILAHAFATSATNPWAAAREALVLYAQNNRNMLKNAAWIAAITYGALAVVFLILLGPALLIAQSLPGQAEAVGVVFALVFAWALKAALFEPFAVACLLQAYFRATAGQPLDPAWEARLDSLSGKFRVLRDRAAAAFAPAASSPGPMAHPTE